MVISLQFHLPFQLPFQVSFISVATLLRRLKHSSFIHLHQAIVNEIVNISTFQWELFDHMKLDKPWHDTVWSLTIFKSWPTLADI